MKSPLLLYSTNTWLAYKIAQLYYKDVHYVWCTSYFNSNSAPAYDFIVPPSSSPGAIYRNYYNDVRAGDKHSAIIAQNKAGILRGANCKEKARVITKKQKAEIYGIISEAEIRDFKPLLFIIPFTLITKLIRDVPIAERAHSLSVEYRIEYLPRKYFDIVEPY
jgi:hypothetical protein